MTPEAKAQAEMKRLVEAVGGCWHETGKITGDSLHIPLQGRCLKCGILLFTEGKPENDITNPSPRSLDHLFEIAEKLAVVVTVSVHQHNKKYTARVWVKHRTHSHSVVGKSTPADALRNALCAAIGGDDGKRKVY